MKMRQLIANFLKEALRPRTTQEIVAIELREAYLAKLEAETTLEYAKSMVDYNQARIDRLTNRLLDLGVHDGT
jgi:hypothetical protein